MVNVNSYIKENVSSVFNNCKTIHVAPDIPEKKINKAVKGFNFDGDINNIVALYDSTTFGSGADGLLFTGERIIYHEAFTDPRDIPYREISKVEHVVDITTKKNGKESKDEYVIISLVERAPVKIKFVADCGYAKLAELLNVITTDVEEYKEEDQLKTIAQLSEELKVAYLQIAVNMAFADDGEVDENEFSEILQLMTRLTLATESRFTIRSYVTDAENLLPLAGLMQTIDENCPESQLKAVHISLVKDLISIFKSDSNEPLENFDFFNKNRSLFNISDEEVELAEMAIDNDRKMISNDYDDTMVEKSLKELAAKSAAVGVPLGAVYLSGSVIGMSAAGLSSGLASLGLGGALGLSSMATGIGVAVLLGVGAYKGIKHLTGANELEGNKRRELMLNDVIKQTQKTISDLINDINYVTDRLNTLIKKGLTTDNQIQKLMSLLSTMTKSAGQLTQKSTTAQNNSSRLKCPAILNIDRLENLTQEATKKPVYELAMASYIESSKAKSTNAGDEHSTEYRLAPNLLSQELEDLATGFNAIGYFDASSVAMGAVGEGVGKAKDKLKGLFS